MFSSTGSEIIYIKISQQVCRRKTGTYIVKNLRIITVYPNVTAISYKNMYVQLITTFV